MAISWLSVLQNVPWTDVISNAPKVADGAKKLWSSVGRKRDDVHRDAGVPEARQAEGAATAVLRGQIADMEEELDELRGQLVASSGLIKDLADQNAQLIARVELMRRRMTWLAGVTAVSLVAALGALALTLLPA